MTRLILKTCGLLMWSCIFLSKLSVTKVTNYGNGNSNGIIEDIVFFGGNIDDTVFLGLISSSASTSCWLVVRGKKENILISFLKQESKMPHYLK